MTDVKVEDKSKVEDKPKAKPVVDEEPEEFDAAYYGIRVNGKIVWQSEGEPMLIDRVTISNARGEVTVVGSHNNDTWLDITVNERSVDDPMTYLDIEEAEKLKARQERFEPEADKTRPGYVEADPETGVPMEDTRVPTVEEKKAADKSTETEGSVTASPKTSKSKMAVADLEA